jgi:hypothetical protein
MYKQMGSRRQRTARLSANPNQSKPLFNEFWFLAVFGGAPGNLDGLLSFGFPIPTETSANHSVDRSGDSGERRKHLKIE